MAPKKEGRTSDQAPPAKKPKVEKKPKSEKKPKAEEGVPTTDDQGWTLFAPSMIYKVGEAKGSTKIAGFDLDGTLVTTQSGMAFARTENDWKLFNGNVEEKIHEHFEKGYKIVIFSNQGGIRSAVDGKMAQKTKARMDAVVGKLGVPVQIFMSLQKDAFRKPESGMWDYMVEHCNDGLQPDMSESFFVGDFAGREQDPDQKDNDKEFAVKLGIKFFTPEQFFGAAGAVPSSGPNAAVIDVLMEMATILKSKGGKEIFKGSALAKAANAIKDHGKEITTAKEAQKLAGVGKSSSAILEEVVKTGKCAALEELRNEDGEGLKQKEKDEAKKKAQGAAFKFL